MADSRPTPVAEARALPAVKPPPRTSAPDGDSAEVLNTPVGLGLTVGDVRGLNEAAAARARGEVENGPAMATCRALASAGLVVRCLNIRPSGLGVVETVSFELPDPAKGRGIVNHYRSPQYFETAVSVTRDLAVATIGNPRALVLALGAEGWTAAESARARAVVSNSAR
jgi:hypothetical protein